MKKNQLIIYLLMSYAYNVFGQCDVIQLNNQQSINDFIINYSNCSEVNNLDINNVNGDITNLGGLFYIENIKGTLKITTNEDSPILNISGLFNLKFVNNLNLNLYNTSGNFPNLTEVNQFNVNIYGGRSMFSAFPKLNRINELIQLNNYTFINEDETPYFTIGNNFNIIITRTLDSTSAKIFGTRLQPDRVKSLQLFPIDNFKLHYFPILDSLQILRFHYYSNLDFSAVEHYKNLQSIALTYDKGGNTFGNGFRQTQILKHINIQNTSLNDEDFKRLFPNLNKLYGTLIIFNNQNKSLNFLDNTNIQDSINFHIYNSVNIDYNNKLIDCNTPFLCKILERFPDRIYMSRNGKGCDLETVTTYCDTYVNTKELDNRIMDIFPNPAYDIIYIRGIEKEVSFRIWSVDGRLHSTGKSQSINIEKLEPGIYIMDIFDNFDYIQRTKFIKM